MRRLFAIVTLAAAAALVSPTALSAEEEEGEAEADRTVTVTATDFDFSPKTIEIEPSTTLKIVLVNEGNVTHSWAIPELDKKSDRIQPGNETSITLSPEDPGTYEIACQVPGHKEAGMVGELVVTAGE